MTAVTVGPAIPGAGNAVSRPRFVAVTDLSGWRLKTYQIAANHRLPASLRAVRRLAADVLPERPDLEGAYGVGFVIVHNAGPCYGVLIDWWVRPDELHQRAFVAPPDQPHLLAPLCTATVGRIPELVVVSYERKAWLRNVLARPSGPDIEGYLADTLA